MLSQKTITLLRWAIPASSFVLAIGYEIVGCLVIGRGSITPAVMVEILLFGLVGPLLIWIVLGIIAGDITERQRAETEIQQRMEDLALINSLNNTVNRGGSLQEITRVLCREITRIFSCFGTAIYLFSEDKQHLIMQNSYLPPAIVKRIEKLIGMSIPVVNIPLKEGSLYLRALQAGKPQLINDRPTIQAMIAEITKEERMVKLAPKVLKLLDICSLINIPLMAEGEAIGLLNISRDEPFTESDLQRLEAISEQLTVIIEHKRAGEALKLSEERYALAQRAANIGSWDWDIRSGELHWSNQIEPMFGFGPGEFDATYETFLACVHPQDRQRLTDAVNACLEEGKGYAVEHRIIWPDGTVRWVAEAGDVIRDESGKAIRMLGIVRDITKHKQAEEALRRHADEQTALYAVTAAASTSLDPEELLSTILDVVLPVLSADAGWAVLPGPTLDDPPHLVAWRGVPESLVRAEMSAPLRTCPVCAPLLNNGKAQTEPQLITACPRLPPETLAGASLYSHVGIPLSAGGKVLGVLQIAWRTPRPCPESDGALLTAIGQQVGIALRNAQLYQTARQMDHLRVLTKLDRALAATLDPGAVAESTLRQVAAALDASSGALFLLPPSQTNAHAKWAFTLKRGWIDITLSGKERQQLQAFLQRFRESQEAISLSADELLKLSDRHHKLAERWGAGGLAVPIWSDEELIAVLALGGRSADRPLTKEDRALAQAAANRAGQAIQNARLYQNAQRQATQLAVVNEAARRAVSILDMDQLLQEVVTTIQKSFNYHSVSLFLLDEAGGDLEMRAIDGSFPGPIPPNYRQAIGEGMIGRAAKTGQPLLANDVSQAPHYITGFSKKPMTKAELCVPLKLADRVIGVLDIQSTQLNAFDEADLLAMETLADQIAVAIENARLYQETVRRLEEAQVFSTVATALTRSLDLDQVLQAIVDSATHLIPASTGGVLHLVDEARGKLVPRAISSPGINIQEKVEMSIGEGIAGLVMQEKQPLNVPDVEKDGRFIATETDTSTRSLLVAPLLIDSTCIGTLSLNSDQVRAFSADDERLLTTLAAQAAVAVRNARLHQEIQRRLEEVVFLNRVGRVVTSSLDLEQVLTTVMEETILMLGTEAGSILLLDEENKELVFEAAVGPHADKLKGLRLPLNQGIAGWVVQTGQRLLAPKVKDDPRFYPGVDETIGFVTKSLLAIPLKVRGEVIGVIEAVNKTEGDFSQADVRSLSSMAQWAAIAIENARLFTETQRRFEEMAALYSVSLDITARLEMPDLLKSIVERAVGLLQAEAGGVYLYDREQENLRLAIGYNYVERYVGVTLKPGEGLAGKVLQTERPLIVNDYRTWEGRAAAFESNHPFTATLGVPLKWQKRILGVLVINADARKRTFDQDDIWLAILFAHQAAIALENAHLYEELQERMEEQKRIQAQLSQSEKLVALGQLAASLAHEINNPLQSVIGCLGLAQEELSEGGEVDQCLQIALDEVRRVARTVTQMRDLHRPAPGEREPTAVNALLEQVLGLSKKRCQESGIEVIWQPAADLPLLPLMSDQIRQVFLNLLLNAIEAMPQGGRLRVSTAYTGQPSGVSVEFTDSGMGIAADVLPRIFEPFYSTKPQGSGLGLFISHSIVEQHGGYITVKSQVGEGSTFTVWLPAPPI